MPYPDCDCCRVKSSTPCRPQSSVHTCLLLPMKHDLQSLSAHRFQLRLQEFVLLLEIFWIIKGNHLNRHLDLSKSSEKMQAACESFDAAVISEVQAVYPKYTDCLDLCGMPMIPPIDGASAEDNNRVETDGEQAGFQVYLPAYSEYRESVQ